MAPLNDPFRPSLTFGNVYSRTFALLAKRLDLFMVNAVFLGIPYLCLAQMFKCGQDDGCTPERYFQLQLIYWFFCFVKLTGMAAIVLAVTNMYINDGRHPGTIQCLEQGWKYKYTLCCGQAFVEMIRQLLPGASFFELFVITDVQSLVVVVGGLVVQLYLATALPMYIAVVIIENKSAVDGLKRSCALLSKNFWFAFWTSSCLPPCMGLISGAFSLLFPPSTFDGGMLGFAIQNFLFCFVLPLQAILNMVVYFNIRVTHEDLNRDVLAMELNSSTTNANSEPFPDYHHYEFRAILGLFTYLIRPLPS
jgi:hypothetical protein